MSEYRTPATIQKSLRGMAADWLACGIDPGRSIVFVQSEVPEHLELAMILGSVTDLPRVERVPTFKEQVEALKDRDVHTYAFLGYPILQCADIALYKADTVPVGEDQVPHLELAREIVRRFHAFMGRDVFPEPEARLTPAPRLLGTDRRKMSKSYGNTIELSAPPETVTKQVMSMITDESRIKRSDPGHPEICNVCGYYKVFAPERAPVAWEECRTAKRGCVECKRELAGVLNELLDPIRARREDILSREGRIDEMLTEGARRAAAIARETMREVREVCGVPRRGA
jgi:tryptophanyl-tRNA synthetase